MDWRSTAARVLLAMEERADAERAGAGVDRSARGSDGLTSRQRCMAQLACEGLTDREIAQTLFLTEKTIEGHLAGAFRTLGVSSRRELAEVMRRSPQGRAQPPGGAPGALGMSASAVDLTP
jgi:DNA-binding NarL/FixJ family response regulator